MSFVKSSGVLLWLFPNAAVEGSILSTVRELQLIDESQEMIVIISFPYSVPSLFPSISFFLFSLPVMNLLSPKGFQYSCVLCPGHFWTELLQLTLHMNTGGHKSLVDWIFLFVLGLTCQGFGRGLLWGKLVQGWLLWEENRKFTHARELLLLPAPGWAVVRQAVPCIWALTYSLEETGRFWHLIMVCRKEWPSNWKCIQALWAEQE